MSLPKQRYTTDNKAGIDRLFSWLYRLSAEIATTGEMYPDGDATLDSLSKKSGKI